MRFLVLTIPYILSILCNDMYMEQPIVAHLSALYKLQKSEQYSLTKSGAASNTLLLTFTKISALWVRFLFFGGMSNTLLLTSAFMINEYVLSSCLEPKYA
jgi:hypothetical protein